MQGVFQYTAIFKNLLILLEQRKILQKVDCDLNKTFDKVKLP